MRFLALGFVLASALATTSRAAVAADPLLAEPVEGEKIRVDGDLREWPSRMPPLEEPTKGKAFSARALVGYDEKNLYLAARIGDNRITRTATPGAADDHLTLSLAIPRGRAYVTYEVEVFPGKPGKLPAAVHVNGRPAPGGKAVENADGKELLLEAQVPWSAFAEAAKTRVGLRAAISYTKGGRSGAQDVVSTASGSSGKALPPLLLEGEQGLATLLRERGLSQRASREAYGNLTGDAFLERVAVFGPYLTITGNRFRGGKEFYFAELGASGSATVTSLQLHDFDADGRHEVVVRKRVGSEESYREVVEVVKVGAGDAPFVAFAHEIGIKTPEGSVANKLKLDGSAIELHQGESDGFEPDTYAEALPGGMPSALLPWESVSSRRYEWQGKGFSKHAEEKRAGAVASKARAEEPRKQAGTRAASARQPAAPRPPSADELSDRVYALYKKERGVGGGRARFDFVTDIAGDDTRERVVIHDKDIIAFGKGFRNGTSYAFISVGVEDAKDILDATARDLTGDGKAEILLRAVLRTKASKALGGDTVDRHALLVYAINGDRLMRIFGAETGRVLGKNRILAAVAFEPEGRAASIELRPSRAIGWTEESYPFPVDTAPAGGLEPLLLPWASAARRYRYDGNAFVGE